MNIFTKATIVALTLIATLLLATKVQARDIPSYSGYVNDYSNVLNSEQKNNLEQKIKAYDQQTTNQVAVLIIDSTDGQDIRDFGIKVFDKWKVGQTDKDNGIIFIIAVKDRKMSIEVGTGLEGDLTDVETKHIIDDEITPHFKENDYYSGIDAGLNKVMGKITPDYSPTPTTGSAATNIEIPGWVIILIIVIFLIFLAVASSSDGGDGFGTGLIVGSILSDSDDDDSSGFGGFGGGSSSGGGAASSW